MLVQRRKTSSQVQKLRAKKRCGHVVLRGWEKKGKGRGSTVRGKAGEDRGKEKEFIMMGKHIFKCWELQILISWVN